MRRLFQVVLFSRCFETLGGLALVAAVASIALRFQAKLLAKELGVIGAIESHVRRVELFARTFAPTLCRGFGTVATNANAHSLVALKVYRI